MVPREAKVVWLCSLHLFGGKKNHLVVGANLEMCTYPRTGSSAGNKKT